ncbi:hypothetical protein J6590_085714 [Homalodisca vitripennis]|nr:hypothetical protein J6590_085714 [Homalodisca vitripennis]
MTLVDADERILKNNPIKRTEKLPATDASEICKWFVRSAKCYNVIKETCSVEGASKFPYSAPEPLLSSASGSRLRTSPRLKEKSERRVTVIEGVREGRVRERRDEERERREREGERERDDI